MPACILQATEVTLSGISFEHSAWHAPSTSAGFLERYGGMRYLLCDETSKATGSCFEGADACVNSDMKNLPGDRMSRTRVG
jgi:hypothetical protein